MEKKLEVKNLQISFRTQGGILKAVRDISFDLYVKLDSAQDFKLSSTSSVTKTGTNNTHTAVRVAFVKIGTAETKDAVDALAASLGNDAAPAKALIWEPNAKATAAGSNRAAKDAYKGVNSVITENNAIMPPIQKKTNPNAFKKWIAKNL